MDERMSESAAEVIAESLNTEIVGHSGDYNGGRLTYSRSLGLAIQGLDALREAGYGVVKLPKPDDDHGDGIAFWTDQEVGVADGMVVARFDPGNEAIYYNPTVAKDLASALLAAAAAVSQDGDSGA